MVSRKCQKDRAKPSLSQQLSFFFFPRRKYFYGNIPVCRDFSIRNKGTGIFGFSGSMEFFDAPVLRPGERSRLMRNTPG
jgi:hypothetical protein